MKTEPPPKTTGTRARHRVRKPPKNMAATGVSGMAAFRYDVFSSSDVAETRNTFTSNIYKAMVHRQTGVNRYLGRHDGDPIDDLVKAVDKSKICVLVLSRDYASSARYLRELARGTMHDERKILSIFYDVTPLDDELSTELYLKDLEKHEQRHGAEMRKQWSSTLGKVAEIVIKGWESQGNSPIEVIENTVKQVLINLRPNKRPLNRTLISSEVGHTSGVDDRSVRRRITSREWERGKLLGKGSFGEVYQALTNDGFSFAVKEVSLVHEGCEQRLLCLKREISLLKRFRHDNIVRYYGNDEDAEKLYLFLELMTEGSLVMLYKKRSLSDSEVSTYVRQILNGLKYLHDQKFAHRDIKCANILVDASGSVKLADFGSAKVIKMNGVNSVIGSSHWMAPEVFHQKDTGYGLAADIWSVGCTVLELFKCRPPYSPSNEVQALFKIFNRELPPFPNDLSSDAQDFISRCLQLDPDKRPSAAELLDHPFVRNASSSFASPHFNNVQL